MDLAVNVLELDEVCADIRTTVARRIQMVDKGKIPVHLVSVDLMQGLPDHVHAVGEII